MYTLDLIFFLNDKLIFFLIVSRIGPLISDDQRATYLKFPVHLFTDNFAPFDTFRFTRDHEKSAVRRFLPLAFTKKK